MLTVDNWSEFSWAVGLFEGEGCISIYEKRIGDEPRLTAIALRLGMTDEDVVQRFQRAMGVGKISTVLRRKSHHKTLYMWAVRSRLPAVELLRLMLPQLGARRRDTALRALRLNDSRRPLRRRIPPKLDEARIARIDAFLAEERVQ